MIQIVVVSRQGVSAGQPASAQFGPAGGTIGRAHTNTLVLDDPDRTVSRVHAQVSCRDGQYFIVDRGSNPLQSNGRPLGHGREIELVDGDRLVIGSFELSVQGAEQTLAPRDATASMASAQMAATDDDPFADLLAGLSPPSAPAAAAPTAHSQAPARAGTASDPLLFPDPMARSAPTADDPFGDLLGPAAAASPAGPAFAGIGGLDDFSDLGLASPSGASGGIDALFGGMGGGDPGGDPLGLSPTADPLRQPNTASDTDPLAAFQRAAPVAPRPRADNLPIAQFAYVPPKAVPAPVPASAPDDMAGEPIRIAAPPPAKVRAAPPPPAQAPVQPPASGDVLMDAFLRGLGSTHQPPAALTPELMERVGSMLRSATEGTLQLLLTRQEFKREVRAEVTMIAAQANNPLKFSPTVDVALAHLLGGSVRGFMPAEAAMRDAFNDLRAHQFGVMVGMRAALAHVIARFEPAELEKKIAARSALDALFSANRKARLWDQFVALYAGIATEAEDDFHSLFGKAFLAAYEEQMARLKDNA